MHKYYDKILSGKALQRVYEIASLRVGQYLSAEIDYCISFIKQGDYVLDTGCGYGRIMKEISHLCRMTVGIDNSLISMLYGRKMFADESYIRFYQMDAGEMGFRDNSFDIVLCLQNGISAFKVDKVRLIRECVRIAKPDGKILFSTYSEKFWNERLAWFKVQADEHLIGEIDEEATGNGKIVCKDGFSASTVSPKEFHALGNESGITGEIVEVDESSLFFVITK
ncbi:MAG: class I SAM-dependent methyltransferase [Candidatus Marinimicrobia bacterium]|nr:class I SAM-dependent methyltransferase [Candidatus Neomarinimicrobiota bacterium]